MASTKFAVIHSKATGRVRWVLRSDDDSEHGDIIVQDGEQMTELDNKLFGNHLVVQNHLNKITEKEPGNDRYAIVHPSGEVKGAILADPLCGDKIDGHELILHEHANTGWKYDHKNKGFIEPERVAKK